tara:strand:- start:266 stop:994 length:729 start_codon:yes stop_codon:yes gene_type:complete
VVQEDKTKLGSDEHYCTSCGEVIKKAAEVCPKCGVRLQDVPSDEKKKRSKLKIGCLAIIAVIIVIVIIALVSSASEEGSVVSSGTSSGDLNAEKIKLYPNRPDSQEKDVELEAGATGSLGGWEVTANFHETKSSLGQWDDAEEGSRFIVIDVSVKRIGEKSANLLGQNFFGSEFRLLTPNGKVLDPSMSTKKPELTPGDMVSGGQDTGYLTYEAPIKKGAHYLLFKPGAFSSARLVWGFEVE